MNKHRADNAKGNNRQNQQRLNVGLELQRQDYIHGKHRDDKSNEHTAYGLVFHILVSLPSDFYARILAHQLRQKLRLELGRNILSVRLAFLDVRGDGD